MTKMALPLSICTYNMQGFNDMKCDYIQKCSDNHDIIMIQEHWLYESQSHVFEDNFPNITSLCVSGMDDSCLSAGRRYGGCAILWKSSLSCSFEPVMLTNKRLCAVQIKLQDVTILLCCIYMPCNELGMCVSGANITQQ